MKLNVNRDRLQKEKRDLLATMLCDGENPLKKELDNDIGHYG